MSIFAAIVASYVPAVSFDASAAPDGTKLVKVSRGGVSTASKALINGESKAPSGFMEGGAKAPVVAPRPAPVAPVRLTHQEFLAALLASDKGKKGEGRLVVPSRDEVVAARRAAVAAYVGLDGSGRLTLATQIDNAARSARSALKLGGAGYQSQNEKRSALASVSGWSAGAVDAAEVRKADLVRRREHSSRAVQLLRGAVGDITQGKALDAPTLTRLREVSHDLARIVAGHASSLGAVAEALAVERARLAQIIADLGE